MNRARETRAQDKRLKALLARRATRERAETECSVQRAGEGSAAQTLARGRSLGEHVDNGGDYVVEDLAELLFRQRRAYTDVADEELACACADTRAVVRHVLRAAD